MSFSRASSAIAVACIVFGTHLWIVAAFGTATPFWDQWDSEAVLLKAYADGLLNWGHITSLNNEHMIVLPKLLFLALYKVRGLWDPMLEMVVNAGIHARFAVGSYCD